MTPRQIELARHALGLTNGHTRSYRNRFIVGPRGPDYIDWIEMAAAGDAERHLGGKLDRFYLTRKGAEAVLRPGESLDPEDFPAEARVS